MFIGKLMTLHLLKVEQTKVGEEEVLKRQTHTHTHVYIYMYSLMAPNVLTGGPPPLRYSFLDGRDSCSMIWLCLSSASV